MQIRIYYEDTDLGGIVYHANYLKFCERARSEIFFSKGLVPIDGNRSFMVTKIEADFLGSATLADMIEVKTSIYQTKKISLILLQEIFLIERAGQKLDDEQKIFSTKVKLAYIEDGKPILIPQEQLSILNGDK